MMGQKTDSFRLEKLSYTFNEDYTKYLHDPAIMAVQFEYWDELIKLLLVFTPPEHDELFRIIAGYPLIIYMNKGCITVTNEY